MTTLPDDTSTYGNVLDIPWVPVATHEGDEHFVTLREVFTNGQNYRGLGANLTPLERETLHRFLPSMGAVILQEAHALGEEVSEALDVAEFPTAAVEAFHERHHESFWLKHPTRPWMQRHDITQADVLAYANAQKKAFLPGDRVGSQKSISSPLMMLHPHVPGGSTSTWAVRSEDRDPADSLPLLALLLAVTWWQTRRGNGEGPDKRKIDNGNPCQVGVRPLSIFWVGENLAQTILAGIRLDWIVDEDNDLVEELPAWLTNKVPTNLEANPQGLWRSTYARNKALVLWEDSDGETAPVAYTLGPDSAPVPDLGGTEKVSLLAMHSRDHNRLYEQVAATKTKPATVKQVNAFDARIQSTEGYIRWLSKRLDQPTSHWAKNEVMYTPDKTKWHLGIYAEVCHTTGSREYSNWTVIPYQIAAPAARHLFDAATQFVSTLRSRMFSPLTLACEGRTRRDANPVLQERAYSTFYSLVENDLLRCFEEIVQNPNLNLNTHLESFARTAVRVFDQATETLLSPATAPLVYTARQRYKQAVRAELNKVTGPSAAAITPTASHGPTPTTATPNPSGK